ncbi:hypothetical protein MRX96_009276 [Rhipicephalus microplus]
MTSLPSSDDNRPEINHGKAAAVIAPKQGELVTDTAKSRDCGPVRQEDGTNAQNKPKASSGLVIANAGDEGASKQPSKTNSLAEDTYVAPTGAVKTSSVEEQPGADGVKGTCEGQATREETSVGTSVERTTAREQRHHKKFNKQHRDGGVSDGIGSETTAIPEAGCDADTTTTKRKRKHTTGADGVVSNGLSSPEEHSHGGLLVPKSHSSSRRLSTKSRSSHKSATSGDTRSDALTSPPTGWTSGQAPNVVAATAETAVTGDDDTFLSKWPEMDGRDVQPPTPPHPNTDVFSREHSSLIEASEPVGAALTPAGEGASGQMTPNVIRSASGACESPTPMKPSLMDFSRERSPNTPASPHKTPYSSATTTRRDVTRSLCIGRENSYALGASIPMMRGE